MKAANNLALLLVIVGALNWGLVGVFGFNLVAALLGDGSALSQIVYTLVGISGIWLAIAASSGQMSSHHAMAREQ